MLKPRSSFEGSDVVWSRKVRQVGDMLECTVRAGEELAPVARE